MEGLGLIVGKYKPHLVMTVASLCPAIFMVLLQSLLSKGIAVLVLVVYDHTIAALGLFILAFFLERGKRPPLTFQIVCYAFLLGFLQITVCQALLAVGLKFNGATNQSIALNTNSVIVFVLAVGFGLEELHLWTLTGQAKTWGVLVSAAGALVMTLWNGPALLLSSPQDHIIGGALLAMALLAGAFWILLLGYVSKKYPAELSLTALMTFFGTAQTAILTAFLLPTQAWKVKWYGGQVLLVLLLGGIVMTGFMLYAQTWCVRKKGPVFTTAFSPLLIVFSFLLETFLLKKTPHLGSIIGAILIVSGLYLLLWGKAKESEKEEMVDKGSMDAPLI